MGEIADDQIQEGLDAIAQGLVCPKCGGDVLGMCECDWKEQKRLKKRKNKYKRKRDEWE